MPDHRAVAIANEFLERRANGAWPQQMLIHKLAHIANGWMLAISGQPLIGEDAEAWDNGPVYRSLWNHVRDHGYGSHHSMLVDPERGIPYKADLAPTERSIIDRVWRKYAPMGAVKLSELTHQPGTPWTKAYLERGRNSRLDPTDIREHYVKLAMAGREQSDDTSRQHR